MSDKIERRVLPTEDVELRVVRDDHGDPTTITGYAAVFNRDSVDLGGFIEQVRPGAFTNTLKTSDVRGLVNHDSNLLLGRTKSGTLHLTEDKRGLKFSIDLADTQAARDAAESISRGDIDGCSFSFQVVAEEWRAGEDGEPDMRALVEVDPLFDVGPVTFPAYPDTTVAARSLDAWRETRTDGDKAAKESELPATEATGEPEQPLQAPQEENDLTPDEEDAGMREAARDRTKQLARTHVDNMILRNG